MEDFVDCICGIGVVRSLAESLKGFLNMNDPLEDVKTHLQNKISSRCRDLSSVIKQVLADLQEIKEASVIIGIKVNIISRSLLHLHVCYFVIESLCKKDQMSNR